MIGQAVQFGRYLLDRNPFIRLLAISGSLTDAYAVSHQDNDYFILCKEGRVWECFAACVFYGFLYSLRIGRPRTFFCFNYIIDETYANGEIRIDEKSARELLNLKVIHGNAAFRRLLKDKKEIDGYYPAEYTARLLSIEEDTAVKPSRGLPFVVVKPAFKALSKLFEARRRSRHDTGKIYSNDRVIRSHLHK